VLQTALGKLPSKLTVSFSVHRRGWRWGQSGNSRYLRRIFPRRVANMTRQRNNKAKRYGMTIDVDRCTGLRACMVACAVETTSAGAEGATERKGITWIRVFKWINGEDYRASGRRSCGALPAVRRRYACVHVCPSRRDVIRPPHRGQMPDADLAAATAWPLPYHARYSNWWDPAWPAGMVKTLNPDVAPACAG